MTKAVDGAEMIERLIAAVASVTAVLIGTAHNAVADTVSNGVSYVVVPDRLAGGSPNGLGDWTVDYQKIDGGDPVVSDAVNRIVDDEANGQVALYVAASSRTKGWTFHTTGTLQFRPVTIAEIFLGQYNAPDLPNMPVDTVGTRVFDARSGAQIVWDNLFRDPQAGLARMSDLTAKILPATYPMPLGGWSEYVSSMAPVDANFKFWVPTDAGIELHFPDHQFGRGQHVITVPWSDVRDLIAPEFVPITQ
ncbi:MAG: DUF3298 domain-containing protein [Mycobacterium sp.]